MYQLFTMPTLTRETGFDQRYDDAEIRWKRISAVQQGAEIQPKKEFCWKKGPPLLMHIDVPMCARMVCSIPTPSMYGIFTYIWLIFMVHVGKYNHT